jgi:glycerophosphoryl diester phosphodiesterase
VPFVRWWDDPWVHPYLSGPHPRAYAHRGWHLDDLDGCENTLAAFRRAVDEGFAYLELDVHASADGVAHVHHDARLDRTTDGSGALAARTSAELAGVLVRGREPIPRLDEVLAALPDTRITIELKATAAVAPMLAAVEAADAWHRVCVGGFDQSWLTAARDAGGQRLCTSMAQRDVLALRSKAWLRGVEVLPLRGDLAQVPVRFGPLTVVDRRFLDTAHAAGREVHVWTVDDPAEMDRLLDLGVDGLLSDRPDLLRATLEKRGQWQVHQ